MSEPDESDDAGEKDEKDEKDNKEGEEKDEGPGKLPDALAPFAKAIIDAAKTETDADPDVLRAFALGWHMAELYRPRTKTTDTNKDRLIRMSALDEAQRRSMLVAQINADLTLLKATIEKAGLKAPPLAETPAQGDVEKFHITLLTVLTAADFRLGKAYGLARALADISRASEPNITDLFTNERITPLLGWLDELSTAFPPHAAGSVSHSLALWRDCDTLPENALTLLRRQGEMWRALLSGEKRATEALKGDDYLDAARGLASETRRLVWSALIRFPIVTLAIVVFLAVGIYLLTKQSPQSTVAGATSVIAGLGLTWKGLGGGVGKLIARVEIPLWGAQLDIVIGKAITTLDVKKKKLTDPWNRRTVAAQMPRPDVGNKT